MNEEEHRWLQEHFIAIEKLLRVQTDILNSIKTAVIIMALIILITAVLATCSALGLHL
jgi:hypothetical protein